MVGSAGVPTVIRETHRGWGKVGIYAKRSGTAGGLRLSSLMSERHIYFSASCNRR